MPVLYFSGTDSSNFQDQILSVPVLFFGTNFFLYRYQYHPKRSNSRDWDVTLCCLVNITITTTITIKTGDISYDPQPASQQGRYQQQTSGLTEYPFRLQKLFSYSQMFLAIVEKQDQGV